MQPGSKVAFKDYTTNQILLLPPSLEELIEANHPVRTVSAIIDKLNLDCLIEGYKGGGTSSHHPRMLLKVLVFGYLSNVYSSRKLEEALSQNIYFMWLAGMNKPDHNTINRFRSDRLKDKVKAIFSQIVILLEKEGQLSLKSAFTDGTKIEANANRYTFVWGKAIKKSRERIEKQLEDLWNYTQSIAKEELKDQTEVIFKEIDSIKVKDTIAKIDSALKDKKIDPKVRQKLNYARRQWPGKLEKYKTDEKILGKRNSYSKTDNDATFMRMKEDHMRNGQLKPGYNLQISTNKQFILNYSLHPNPTDTKTLASHLDSFKHSFNKLPEELTADAGYGSEENYKLLEKLNVRAYVKYNSFDKEQKKKKKEQGFKYDQENDAYHCPEGKPLHPVKSRGRKTSEEYGSTSITYRNISCEGCPLKQSCNPTYNYKKFQKNQQLAKIRTEMKTRLNTERGIELRKQRAHDVETVFAQIKHNKGFKRFMLRGMDKVAIETGLIAIAHNLKKAAA